VENINDNKDQHLFKDLTKQTGLCYQ